MKWLLAPNNALYEVEEFPGYVLLRGAGFVGVPTDLETAQAEGSVVSEDISELIRLRLNRKLTEGSK